MNNVFHLYFVFQITMGLTGAKQYWPQLSKSIKLFVTLKNARSVKTGNCSVSFSALLYVPPTNNRKMSALKWDSRLLAVASLCLISKHQSVVCLLCKIQVPHCSAEMVTQHLSQWCCLITAQLSFCCSVFCSLLDSGSCVLRSLCKRQSSCE